MSAETIIVQDLSYNYGDLKAVDQISFKVNAGQVFGFLGPNGAGKSTTVNMLTGQLRPKSGLAKILGADIATQAKSVQAQIGVGFEISNHYEQPQRDRQPEAVCQALQRSKLRCTRLAEPGWIGRPRQRCCRKIFKRHETALNGRSRPGQRAQDPLP